jgi:hypothetical protein
MAATNEARELTRDARTRADSQPITGSESRRMIATYPDYAGAGCAVDWLSDQGFAVEHIAIVGKACAPSSRSPRGCPAEGPRSSAPATAR